MNSMEWIKKKSTITLNPAQVQNTLERISESWSKDDLPLRDLVEQFPLGETPLLHLLAVSSICAARLVRQPDILLWLSDPEICSAPRSYSAMLKYLREIGGDSAAAESDRKSTRLNSSHLGISYAVFCLKKKKTNKQGAQPHEEQQAT